MQLEPNLETSTGNGVRLEKAVLDKGDILMMWEGFDGAHYERERKRRNVANFLQRYALLEIIGDALHRRADARLEGELGEWLKFSKRPDVKKAIDESLVGSNNPELVLHGADADLALRGIHHFIHYNTDATIQDHYHLKPLGEIKKAATILEGVETLRVELGQKTREEYYRQRSHAVGTEDLVESA